MAAIENEAYRRLEAGESVALLHHSPLSGTVCALESHAMPNTAEAYARDLYATLRHYDQGRAFTVLLLEAPPQGQDWLAVNDRVKRATTRCL
jgi:L-threonylcarbamoyladenylate synthase